MPQDLIVKRDGHIKRLTLNRPHKANALSASLVDALIIAVDSAKADGTHLLILDGAGKHFCSGFDLSDAEQSSEGDLVLRFLRIEALLQDIYHAPFETIAFTRGHTSGAGADLVACCGVRVATEDAKFRMPGLQFGIVLGTKRFSNRVGEDSAREILLASRAFDAQEALQIGFLTHIENDTAWSTIVGSVLARCEVLPQRSRLACHEHTSVDTRANDMAALARSVVIPGLKERIREFHKERVSNTV